MHAYAGGDWYLEAARGVDRRVDVGEDVTAAAPQLVRRDPVRDLVGGPARYAVVLPCRLVRRVVRQLVLEEDRRAVLAVPDDVVFLVVLDEQAECGHIVAVDDESGVGGVERPADRTGYAVVGAPRPDVVEEYVVGVDLQADVRLADVRPTDAEVHVVQDRRLAVSPRERAVPMPGADLEQGW